MTLLPDERSSTNAEGESLPRPGKDLSLESAANDFRRVLPTDGEIDGEPDYADYFRSLEKEAKRLDVLYDRLQPSCVGGREHDVTFDTVTGTVLKFTKPSAAGYVVDTELGYPRLSTALPVEYLDRLALHNAVFGDDVSFVGVGGEINRRRIIARQPCVTGRPASRDEIVKVMTEDLGFKQLSQNYGIGYEDSYGFIRDDVAVFDLRPANVFMTEDGIMHVIDSIPVKLSDQNRHMFG